MPRIASHHANDPYRPLLAWPEGCLVQWGGGGLVLADPPYRTAFFEAFPEDGSAGFIRGEGTDVEAAEADAFAAYVRQRDCMLSGGHRWSRARRLSGFEARERGGRRIPKVSTYTNGGTFCLGCGSFQTTMPEVPRLGAWREPLSYGELRAMMDGFVRPDPSIERREDPKSRRSSRIWRRRLHLRARMFGIDLPDHTRPEHAAPERMNPFEEDPYQAACRRAVVRFYVRMRDRPEAGATWTMEGMFDGITRSSLERAAAELGEEEAAGAA